MSEIETRQAIEQVKLAASIEEVVRARVPDLKRAGAEWKACCPFHAEKSPSFYVNPAKGIWHCFGACGTGGDVISFVQRFDGLAFWEAVTLLAHQHGVPLPKRSRERGDDGRLAALYDTLERAAAHYERKLAGPEGAAARAYLEARGLSSNTARAFGLGWAPEGGQSLVGAAREAGTHQRLLLEAGLVRQKDRGECYDFFRGRLVIPIRDRIGRVVGFGARVLPGADRDGPKYINTPETALFKKGSLVFAIDRALDAARRERHLVLVEGYTDVMAAHQVGISQVVAVLGTSTTAEHAQLVRRTGARRVSLVFDGDEAGRRAAARALRGLLPLGAFEIDVVPMPAGEDPADLLLRAGPDAFRALLAEPMGWFDFLVRGLSGLEPAALADGVDGILSVVAAVPQPVHQEALVRQLAERLDQPLAAVRSQWERLPQRGEARRGRELPGAGNPSASAGVLGGPGGGSAAFPTAPKHSAPKGAGGVGSAPAEGGGKDPALSRRARAAYGGIAAALLMDNSLLPLFQAQLRWGARGPAAELLGAAESPAEDLPACPDPELARVLKAILDLSEDGLLDSRGAPLAVDTSRVMTALLDDPARELVPRLEQLAQRAGDELQKLAHDSAAVLAELARKAALRRILAPSPLGDDERLEQAAKWVRSRSAAIAPAPALGSRPAQRPPPTPGGAQPPWSEVGASSTDFGANHGFALEDEPPF